jgi:acid phosphatase family membrane protein YuiD
MAESPWLQALLAGGVAQAIKVTIAFLRTRSFTLFTLFNLPGMPSTWAAVGAALSTAVGRRDGVQSLGFSMAVAFSALVMYDSLGLRRSAGRQAQLLNAIARDLELHATAAAGRHLRELLGETPAQVAGGILIGVLVALAFGG